MERFGEGLEARVPGAPGARERQAAWRRALGIGLIAASGVGCSVQASGQMVPVPGPALDAGTVAMVQGGAGTALDSAFWWRILDSSWISPTSRPTGNDRGELAWGISYRMEATARYLRLVGSDSAALALLRSDVRVCLGARDNERGYSDYRGRSRPVWSATEYSEPKGERAAWLVQNAMIATGLAAAAWELKTLGPADRLLGDSAYAAAWGAMQAFEPERHIDAASRGAYYAFASDFPIRQAERLQVLPENQLASAGLAWLWLSRVSGSAGARSVSAQLANFLLTRTSVRDSALYWLYQYGSVVDDVSHGGIVAAFLSTLPADTRVGGVTLQVALAHTLRQVIRPGPDSIRVADHVDGSITGDPKLRGMFGQWAELVPLDCDMYRPVALALWSYRGKIGAQGPLGAAALLEAQSRCPGAAQVLADVMR